MLAGVSCALSLVLGLVALLSGAAGAQTATLRGSVFRDSLQRPLGSAEVVLAALGRDTKTNNQGAFQFDGLPPGTYLLAVRRLGFAPWKDSVVLVADEVTTRTVILGAQATVLDSVKVTTALRTYRSPLLRGFEERRQQGFGHFITEDELRKDEGRSLGNVIDRRISGIQHVYDGSAIYLASSRKSGAGPAFLQRGDPLADKCWVSVYLDGVLIYDASRMADSHVKPPDLSHMDTDDFAGIEFYAGGATIPPQFNATSSGCGTLLLWTREK